MHGLGLCLVRGSVQHPGLCSTESQSLAQGSMHSTESSYAAQGCILLSLATSPTDGQVSGHCPWCQHPQSITSPRDVSS